MIDDDRSAVRRRILGGWAAVAALAGCSGSGDPPSPTSAWAAWTKQPTPAFAGQYPATSDPSVLRDGAGYRMAYTCFDPARTPQGPEICGALSADGLSWTPAPVGDETVQGRLLATGAGVWDTAHETALLRRSGSGYVLYFVGYVDRGGILNSVPSAIGMATSTDGLHFTRAADPVLTRTPGGDDDQMISSPTIVDTPDGGSLMVYAGYCGTGCAHAPGIVLLGARSSDGVHWTKLDAPVLRGADVPWPNEGVGEADIVHGPDGAYYLFATVLQGTRPHQIGVARSASPTGPWTFDPQPIVTAGGPGAFDEGQVVAPSVLVEDGRVRMWFHGVDKSGTRAAIGYAQASWPLWTGKP